MMRITNLQKRGDHGWLWHVEGESGYFYTTKGGEGIFHDDPDHGIYNRQLTGLSQFEACNTYSGMRRKLIRWFNGEDN